MLIGRSRLVRVKLRLWGAMDVVAKRVEANYDLEAAGMHRREVGADALAQLLGGPTAEVGDDAGCKGEQSRSRRRCQAAVGTAAGVPQQERAPDARTRATRSQGGCDGAFGGQVVAREATVRAAWSLGGDVFAARSLKQGTEPPPTPLLGISVGSQETGWRRGASFFFVEVGSLTWVMALAAKMRATRSRWLMGRDYLWGGQAVEAGEGSGCKEEAPRSRGTDALRATLGVRSQSSRMRR